MEIPPDCVRRTPTPTSETSLPERPVFLTTFADFGLPAPVVRQLTDQGITTPFPIQTASLPDTMAGTDVLGRGRTGSGKTLAFSLPVVTRLATSAAKAAAAGRPRRRPGRPRALVLCPTRELANQINATMEPLAKALGLVTTTVFGGVAQSRQVTALNAGVDVLIACPGRLEDLLGQKHLTLDDVEITVLDEADHMADLGFLPAVKRLLDATPRDSQRLLFSATLDRGVDVLVKRYLSDPITHSVDSAASEVPQMTHHVFNVSNDHKATVVKELVSGQGRTLAFMRTKHGAKKLAKQLTQAGVPAVDLHGNLSQGARQRNLAAFGDGSVKVLVATDIAARGIHVDDVSLVVHVDPPAEHKAYLHRSGRTARAGAEGVVVTVGTPSQAGDVRTLMRQASIKPTLHSITPGHPMITEVTGPPAEYVTPAAEPARQPQNGGGRRRSGGGSGGGSGSSGARGRGGRGGGNGRGAGNANSRSGDRSRAGRGSGRRSGGQKRSAGSGAATYSSQSKGW